VFFNQGILQAACTANQSSHEVFIAASSANHSQSNHEVFIAAL